MKRLAWLFVVVLAAGVQLTAQSQPKSPVNRSLATLDRVHFRLILPEQSVTGSAADVWQLGPLVGVSMRQMYITLVSDDAAYAIDAMAAMVRHLQPDHPARTLPRLEVMVATKRQGAFVGLAVWLRLFGEGVSPASYNEQGIAPLAEEGPAIRSALEKVLQKFSADIAAARKTP